MPEDSGIWPHVTSTVDNCLNQDCPFYKDCFVVKARQQALAADIVIVNHHLFFADMALQEEGFGELLPGADVIVFDEAHHLPDIAAHFFSTVLTARQLIELARDSEAEALENAKDMQQISDGSAHLQNRSASDASWVWVRITPFTLVREAKCFVGSQYQQGKASITTTRRSS